MTPQITGKGVRNVYGIVPLLDVHVPRGSEYHHSVVLHNPSDEKKILIHRVGQSDPDLILYISASTEIGSSSPLSSPAEWFVNKHQSAEIFRFSYKRSDRDHFFVVFPSPIDRRASCTR